MLTSPINFKKWIDEHRHLLKPPVGNQTVYSDTGNFIVMVVGGPNARKDYHFNETEEFFYQLEGNVTIKIIDKGEFKDIHLNEGDIFLLPARTPHSPQRGPNTVGLVMEVKRPDGMMDGFQWYCENCHNLLHEAIIPVQDIVVDLPVVMNKFWDTPELHTCIKCGTVMHKP